MASFETPPPTELTPEAAAYIAEMASQDLVVLCGRNNSGKSFVLRRLLHQLGPDASYLGPARYNNFNTLAPYGPQRNRKQERYQQLLRHFQQSNQNVDNSPLNLQQAIAELSDDKRKALFEILSELLDVDAEIQSTVPGNSMSQQYISIDGYNLSFTSSGLRLVTTLLTSLLNPDHSYVLIDEPELGLSPEVQASLAEWFLDPEARGKYLPHLSGVVLATHSPVFLDRVRLNRNYRVSKSGTTIDIEPLGSVRDLADLQFSLLGNRFETLLLPSAIVLVEGVTDHAYVSRVLALRFPGATVSVVQARGDGRMADVVATARQMLGDIQRSPYAGRLFAVLDSVHGTGLAERLVKLGVDADKIITWEGNGIEYVYPASSLQDVFGTTNISIDGDRVSGNGHTLTKADLAQKVTDKLSTDTELPAEFEDKLLTPLGRLL